MIKIYLEWQSVGVKVTQKEAKYVAGLKGKDVVFVTRKFELVEGENENLPFVQTSQGKKVYVRFLSPGNKSVGTDIVEPEALLLLRGVMSRLKKSGVKYAFVYEGLKGGNKVHYIFVADKSNLYDVFTAESGKLSIAIREKVRKKYDIAGIVFLNTFEGTDEELKAMNAGLQMAVKDITRETEVHEQFLFIGAEIRDKLLPLHGEAKVAKNGKLVSVEDEAVIKSVYKGLAVLAAGIVVGMLIYLAAVPYLKAIPYMSPKKSADKTDYVALVNDYGQLFQAVKPSSIYPVLSNLSAMISKYGLEPLSYDISETSVTAHIRSRNMDKVLAFRKNFQGQCTEITKEGPYYNFAVTVEVP